MVSELPGSGRIAVGSKGGIFGQDGSAHLWRYDVAANKLERKAVALPEGAGARFRSPGRRTATAVCSIRQTPTATSFRWTKNEASVVPWPGHFSRQLARWP